MADRGSDMAEPTLEQVAEAQALGLLKALSVVTVAAGVVVCMLEDDDEGVMAGLDIVNGLGGVEMLAVALVACNQLTIDPQEDDPS